MPVNLNLEVTDLLSDDATTKAPGLPNREIALKQIKFGTHIGAILAAAAIAIGLSAPAVAANEIHIATVAIPHYAPIFVARHKKFLDEELGKTGAPVVKWTSFAAGPPINESFAAGQQDIGFLGDTPALIGKSAGIDTRVIGIASSGPKSQAVVVGVNSPIRTVRELKGKKVAVTKGSTAQHLLALVLEQGGLSLADIEVINLPNGDIPNAIVTGNVDAGVIWEPVLTKFEQQKEIRILVDGSGIKSNVTVIIAASNFLAKNSAQAKAFLRAYQRGADFIAGNPKEAARLIAADVNLAPNLLEQVLTKFNYAPAIHDDEVQEIRRSEAYLRKVGLTRAAVDVDRLLERAIGTQAGLK